MRIDEIEQTYVNQEAIIVNGITSLKKCHLEYVNRYKRCSSALSLLEEKESVKSKSKVCSKK